MTFKKSSQLRTNAKREELYDVEKKQQDKKFVKEKKELVTIPCRNGLIILIMLLF